VIALPDYRRRRTVPEIRLVVYPDGSGASVEPTGRRLEEVRHRCGAWTPAPPWARVCGAYGERLEP